MSYLTFRLTGDLGAGKTTLSRGLVREKLQNYDIKITSPTYLLDNMYSYGNGKNIIHHFDLYRLPTGCNLEMLGIPGVYNSSLCLIEWPERLDGNLPSEHLNAVITIDRNDNSRIVTLTPNGERWKAKLRSLIKVLEDDDTYS